jgi:GGDEF domain-containing protein
MATAEKLRLATAEATILANDEKPFTVTCSIGLAEGLPSQTKKLPSQTGGTELLLRADKALYHAKACGRNQIRVAAPDCVVNFRK